MPQVRIETQDVGKAVDAPQMQTVVDVPQGPIQAAVRIETQVVEKDVEGPQMQTGENLVQSPPGQIRVVVQHGGKGLPFFWSAALSASLAQVPEPLRFRGGNSDQPRWGHRRVRAQPAAAIGPSPALVAEAGAAVLEEACLISYAAVISTCEKSQWLLSELAF